MRINFEDLPPIIINGHKIEIVNSLKNLGVTFIRNLSWDSHIAKVISRIYLDLKRLRFRAYFLSSIIKKQLVSSSLFPILDYSCLVYRDIADCLDKKFQKLQNHIVHFVYHLRIDTELAPSMRRLEWLTVTGRRKYFMAVFTSKVLTESKPSYLLSLFPERRDDTRSSKRLVSTAQSSVFELPTSRTTTYQCSFGFQAMQLRDSLPCALNASRP